MGNRDHFATWIKDRIEQYSFVAGQDFEVFANSGDNPLGGRPATEYSITLDMAKMLAMVERTVVGRQVREYFIDCEKKLRQQGLVDAAVRQLLLPSPLPWEKRFHDGYYEAIAEMAHVPYSGHAGGPSIPPASSYAAPSVRGPIMTALSPAHLALIEALAEVAVEDYLREEGLLSAAPDPLGALLFVREEVRPSGVQQLAEIRDRQLVAAAALSQPKVD